MNESKLQNGRIEMPFANEFHEDEDFQLFIIAGLGGFVVQEMGSLVVDHGVNAMFVLHGRTSSFFYNFVVISDVKFGFYGGVGNSSDWLRQRETGGVRNSRRERTGRGWTWRWDWRWTSSRVVSWWTWLKLSKKLLLFPTLFLTETFVKTTE